MLSAAYRSGRPGPAPSLARMTVSPVRSLGLLRSRVFSTPLLRRPFRRRFARGDRAVAGDVGFEIAQARPAGAGVQVHLGDGHGAPVLRQRDRAAGVVEDGAEHPLVRYVLVGAADEVDVVLAGAGPGQHGV